MPVIMANAVLLGAYIPSYQHVYSQTQQVALVVGDSPEAIAILQGKGYWTSVAEEIPPSLDPYNLVVLAGGDLSGAGDSMRDYVQGGGGMVYLSDAAASLDLATNHDWIGAQSVAYSGAGENATVLFDAPLSSSLLSGDILVAQTSEMSGAPGVVGLETGTTVLAQYTGGNVFAYSFEPGLGKVFFQAGTDPGVGGELAAENLAELLKSGMLWATTETIAPTDFLPSNSGITTGNGEPTGTTDIAFSETGFQSHQLTAPADPVLSIFVNSEGGLVNPTLFFEADGVEYSFHSQDHPGALLTFASAMNITEVRFEVNDWLGGSVQVGYVMVRTAPPCSLPAGAEVTQPGSIPPDAAQVGTTGIPVGSSIEVPPVPVPVTSLLVGFGGEANGYILSFESGGVTYECPVQPEIIEVTFDSPVVVSDVELKNDGLWGIVGYLESPQEVAAYAKLAPVRETILPPGISVQVDAAAPSYVYSASFDPTSIGPEFYQLTTPLSRLTALWLSAEPDLVEPFVYFRSGEQWYSAQIDQQVTSSLIYFPVTFDIDELYASSSGQAGSISAGYLYPVSLDARAGVDQSVEENQIVYLDGRGSTGEGALTFEWTQIEGSTVLLHDSDSDTAYFSAPSVDEASERLSFRLVITDSEGEESSDIMTVMVRNVKGPNNLPPSIGSIAEATVDEGAQVVLAASAYDPDGDPIKYLWTQLSGPAAVLSGSSTATLSFIAPEVSEDSVLTFQLRVADGLGHAVTKDVLVTVRNAHEDIAPPAPTFSAGEDQVISEGTSVSLSGQLLTGAAGSFEFHWDQVSGMPVTLESAPPLGTTFVAPQINENMSKLTFRLGMFDSEGTIAAWDDISVTVTDSPAEGNVEVTQSGTTSLEVGEAPRINSVDAQPPSEIFMVDIPGPEGVAIPNPAGPVVGIWVNATSGMPGMALQFSTPGGSFVMEVTSGMALAYVFDRGDVSLQNISLTAPESIDQVGVGYYYGQVPLSSLSSPTVPAEEESPPILAEPPSEGAVIKFARENQAVAGLMAIGVPVGIGVALKMVSTRRRNRATLDPAKALFPKSDPIAGEAEKVRPVIEELEKMLGRNLDTAVSASELLDRFGSNRAEPAG